MTYFVDIYGRKNCSYRIFRNKKVHSTYILADDIKQAKELAWEEYTDLKNTPFFVTPALFRIQAIEDKWETGNPTVDAIVHLMNEYRKTTDLETDPATQDLMILHMTMLKKEAQRCGYHLRKTKKGYKATKIIT